MRSLNSEQSFLISPLRLRTKIRLHMLLQEYRPILGQELSVRPQLYLVMLLAWGLPGCVVSHAEIAIDVPALGLHVMPSSCYTGTPGRLGPY